MHAFHTRAQRELRDITNELLSRDSIRSCSKKEETAKTKYLQYHRYISSPSMQNSGTVGKEHRLP
jgi:hypothetical protein